MSLQSDPNGVERLVALCKLWGAVKYFHPYLAYRNDIDWDAALVTAIPKVRNATSAAEYAGAVEDMLAALDDSATRVIPPQAAAPAPPAPTPHPVSTLTADDVLLITLRHYQDLLSDFTGATARLAAVKSALPQARAILFDLRAATPPGEERGMLSFIFRYSGIIPLLSATSLVTASTRSRIHMGFMPQVGSSSGGYRSAFTVVDGRRIEPSPEAKEMPVVFLINAWSELPPEALALKGAGKAAIIAEGSLSEASVVRTHPFELGDGIVAEMRLEELLFEDGSGGLQPDRVVPVAASADVDSALAAALEHLADFTVQAPGRAPLPVRAVPPAENAYSDMRYPSLLYRLLAAFRIWTVINYFFPYKALMDEAWDGVLREFIPRMEQAESALAYHLAVAEMVTHIQDSHGFIESPLLREHAGAAGPPIRVQMVEDEPVVTAVIEEESVLRAGIKRGDVVLKVDGEDVHERIARSARYIAASTPQRLLLLAANATLSGPEESAVALTVRDAGGQTKEVALPRKTEYGGRYFRWRAGEVVRLLSADIGYADLDRLEAAMVDEMFEAFRETKAIIFDMRGYPKGTAWAIAPRLATKAGAAAALFDQPIVMSPDGASSGTTGRSAVTSFVQTIPLTDKPRYPGKTVMLIDERTQSQAEHTGLFFKAANRTTFVGSHTSGANGDVTNFLVPGGIKITFSGASVRYPDGRQLQRVGLVPDIEVMPTIRGIQEGRDEVLESAVAYLERELASSSS